MDPHLHNHFFKDNKYLVEFTDFLDRVAYSERNPLNTEMYFLWSMIRSTQPELFIESGTYKGYSANFICEALKRNGGEVEFVTMGYNLENCLPYSSHRLEPYPFARVEEGDSRVLIKTLWKNEPRSAGFFIDGPKGRNMPPLLFSILRRFRNIEFIAVHDCEKESGSGNRWYIEKFFGKEYPIMYCDSSFQDRFAHLDKTLIGKSETSKWRPYYLNGKRRASYGTETGFILPNLGKLQPFQALIPFYLYRFFRFRLHLDLSNYLHRWRKDENN